MENAMFKCSTKKVMIKTRIEAMSASKRVITTTLPPLFLRTSRRKNCPVLNAMNAIAMSGRNSVPLIIGSGIRFRQKGPIMIPATM